MRVHVGEHVGVGRLSLGRVLDAATDTDPGVLDSILAALGREIGASDLVAYLVDFEQAVLEPLRGDRALHAELPKGEEVATTMPGRAFVSQQPVVSERPDGARIWVPIVEGPNRIGVLALTAPRADPETVATCRELGVFVGLLISTRRRFTDVFNLHRRRKPMGLDASMQWDLLPPLIVRCSRVTVAGLLEPAYHVGGDCFDYALNGPVLDFAIVDAMGHGLDSTLLSSLAVGCYRHNRRESRAIETMHSEIDSVIGGRYRSERFATGQLARLHLDSGVLTWTNAGHPCPLLLRRGKVIGSLSCTPTVPWGVGLDAPPTLATEGLEPGDILLLYTDGVVEARGANVVGFGTERLADLAGRAASDQLPVEEIARHLIRAVLEHHNHELADDATLVMVQWHGARQGTG